MTGVPFYVVLATANREHLLARTLSSLSACQKPSCYRATIVVENGRKGDTETVVNQFAKELSTRYLYIPERNKSKALNHALQMLDEGLIFFTDDDVRLHPGTLQAYAGAAGGEVSGYFYGGPISVDYDEAPVAWLQDYLPPSAKGRSYSQGQLDAGGFRSFLGCNWAAFAPDLRRVGAFDPDFGPGSSTGSRGQETDMQMRLLDSGVQRLYVPQARVWHYVPKERCSPRWALRRALQDGAKLGLKAEPQALDVLGWPSWMVRVWLGKIFKAAKMSLTGDEQRRFAAWHELCRYTGFVRGVRQISAESGRDRGTPARRENNTKHNCDNAHRQSHG